MATAIHSFNAGFWEAFPIAYVRIGDRVRQELGDIPELARSIADRGLLQPIVLMEDGRLIGGRRRIAAFELLGRSDIPAMVVTVDDFLKAQRDENTARKDYTESERIELGRLIEADEKEKAKVRIDEGRARGADIRRNHGDGNLVVQKNREVDHGRAEEIAAARIGYSRSRFRKGKAIADAAQQDPEAYGDLVRQLDETGSVGGTFAELERRRNGTPGRSSIHRKAPYPKPNEELEKGLVALDGIRDAFRLVDVSKLDDARRGEWAAALAKLGNFFSKFAGHVRRGHGEAKK